MQKKYSTVQIIGVKNSLSTVYTLLLLSRVLPLTDKRCAMRIGNIILPVCYSSL